MSKPYEFPFQEDEDDDDDDDASVCHHGVPFDEDCYDCDEEDLLEEEGEELVED